MHASYPLDARCAVGTSKRQGEAGDSTQPARRHHRVRYVLLAALAIVVVAFAVLVGSYLLRGHPGAKSLGAAAEQFQQTSTSRPTPESFALPAAGVYRASGSGTERISAPPNSQNDSAVMPVTVSYAAHGCWLWRIDYNTAHWHEYSFCPDGDRLLLTGQRNFVSWDFGLTSITNLARFTCSPPSPIVVSSPQPGERFAFRCVGTNTAVSGKSTSSGPVVIVGLGTLDIGGSPVQAVHLTRTQTIRGAQDGRLEESWWFAATTGLPLEASRNYRLVTDSPIGKVTYTESGSWRLDSLVPVSR